MSVEDLANYFGETSEEEFNARLSFSLFNHVINAVNVYSTALQYSLQVRMFSSDFDMNLTRYFLPKNIFDLLKSVPPSLPRLH
jgi:hypothetical protein